MRNVALILLGITVAVFILQLALGDPFTDAFLLDSSQLWSRPWILVTSIFLHQNFAHLFLNMYVLFLFGPLLESRIGSTRFFVLYLFSGIVAGFIASFFYARALGASGAIMGMIGTLIILMPDLQLLFFFVVPMPLWMAGIVFVLMDVFGVMFPSGVGNIAHLAGMAVGLWFGVYLLKERKRFKRKFHNKSDLSADDVDDWLARGRI